jgi:hypothetical protein
MPAKAGIHAFLARPPFGYKRFAVRPCKRLQTSCETAQVTPPVAQINKSFFGSFFSKKEPLP